ncbi:non-ribosomal peptide synthetase polyketide synthase, putative [Babesia ovata]|uniref:Non-ribosomal peptide synthetase polyketide synthase, putative n=1 Tax=Babesia ovata TaxID=189622 RepID=A0A2H6KH02_9APIC|nr:non-ribosomal peptide synthetase polyketide synthase, putative [Babesia ovata]GBE62249.1 non-ribosomal peptide synthetase polyketide synthase, putative [Babesia ovata]
MADFCRFFVAAGETGNRATLEKLRGLLAHERDSFRICIQTLSHLLGVRLNELIRFDRSFVMKDDVVSIYLSGELPESVAALLADLDREPTRKHAVALQISKLLKARLHYGLDDVVQTLDGAPAKDLYSRSIACLLRICVCALKAECDMRRGAGGSTPKVQACVVDETGTSLCEILARCCIILCIFGAQESNLFDDVRQVQETLLRLVPGPLTLHIIAAFPVVAFDGDCLFTLQNRRIFVEALAAVVPELLDHILIFNRIGAQQANKTKEGRRSRDDGPDANQTRGDSARRGAADTSPVSAMSPASILDATLQGLKWGTKGDGYSTRAGFNCNDSTRQPGAIHIDTEGWEFAFGNIPRVRTLSLLLEFILRFVKISSDGKVEKQMLGWLDALVSKPSFVQTFAPVFSIGNTHNFENILELSRILGKDIFVSHTILSVGCHSDEALRMVTAAGLEMLTSNPEYTRKILMFLVEGVSKRPQEVIECWCTLLRPLVLPQESNAIQWQSERRVSAALLDVVDNLIAVVAQCALMQNFGDECHPDEDNVHACTARQLLVMLVAVVGTKRVASRLTYALDAAHEAMEETVSVETVQVLEFGVFCVWLLKLSVHSGRNKKLLAFVKQINERTLGDAIEILERSAKNNSIGARLETLERIKRGILASRLKEKVEKHEAWFDDLHINQPNIVKWETYYSDCAGDMLQQLTDVVLNQLPTVADPKAAAAPSEKTPTRSSTKKASKGSRKGRGTAAKMATEDRDHVTYDRTAAITSYVKRAKLLLRLHRFNRTKHVDDNVYATIVAVMVRFDIPLDDCTEIFGLMIDRCPPRLLTNACKSGLPRLSVTLLNAMALNLDERYAEVITEIITDAMASYTAKGRGVKLLAALMQLIARAAKVPRLLVELLATDAKLSTLQNFVVFVNCLKIKKAHFLEARGAMNFALIQRYLQYGTAQVEVTVTKFLQQQLRRFMTARAAHFSMSLHTHGDQEQIQEEPAAKGQLNTLDALVISTFRVFFVVNTPSAAGWRSRPQGQINDVFHWNLLGREYYIAFGTIALLFSCFHQLDSTKFMFLAEHFIGIAARINGDTHSTARRSILTDHSLLRNDAVEYFYQVYRNLARRFTLSRTPKAQKTKAA